MWRFVLCCCQNILQFCRRRRRSRIVAFGELSNVIQSGRIRNSDEYFYNDLKDEQTKISF